MRIACIADQEKFSLQAVEASYAGVSQGGTGDTAAEVDTGLHSCDGTVIVHARRLAYYLCRQQRPSIHQECLKEGVAGGAETAERVPARIT